jgi:hypothetical protein
MPLSDQPEPSPDEQWNDKYDDLVRFHQRFGHSYVPHPWPEQPGLGVWVREQRRQRLSLTPGQVTRLDQIHFFWTDGWENLGADWCQKQKEVMGRFYRDPEKPTEHFSIHRQLINWDDDDLESR